MLRLLTDNTNSVGKH